MNTARRHGEHASFETRYVWHLPDHSHVSYATEAEGHALHGRGPDAIGIYRREAGGLRWLRDEPIRRHQ